jgi:erythronate-4-phosphate dehydrogenase
VRIVCAASVLFGPEAFGTLGDVVVRPDHLVTKDDLRDADALIVRSKTRVDARLLEGTSVGFVGTATAGTDHFDLDFLNTSDLAWCAAPGCNADSVAEYVTAALLCLAHRHALLLEKLTLGVVGVGQAGHRVVRKAEAIGMSVLRNDPPLKAATGDPAYVELDEVLRGADIITLHVPLTRTGPWPTAHLANCHFFEHAKPGCVLINTARGEVMDSDGLLFALEKGTVSHAVLDVWEHEPNIPHALLCRVDIGTPHIAGYAFEGRINGTLAAYREACHFFEVEPVWMPDERLFPPAPVIRVDARGRSDEDALWQIVSAAYNIEADDHALRQGAGSDADRSILFDALRRDYADRREFPAAKLAVSNASPLLQRKITGLGFRLQPA